MPTQIDLVISQSALRMDCAVRADAVNDEALVGDRGLEALEAVPWDDVNTRDRMQSFGDGTYRSCCRSTQRCERGSE